jgi:putative membrane protein
MRKWSHLVVAGLFAVALAACESRPAENTRDDAGAGAGAGVEGGAEGTSGESVGMMEREFIENQMQDGETEIRLGRLASERGSSSEIKQFAQMMVEDHTKAATELQQLVRSENLQVESPQENADDDLYQRLSKLSGAEFDREYIDAMVEDHEEAVNALERHTDSDNASVKQFATGTLPVVRQHLEKARQIQQGLERTNTNQ